jgi:hypothetical protein
MPIVFFEGFNNADSDLPKLDSTYWSTNNLSNIYYAAGRTNNCIYMNNRPVASGTGLNTTLTLSNFTDPLSTNNSFAIGFNCRGNMVTETGVVPSPAKWLTFFRSGVAVLDLDFVKTTYSGNPSVGIAVKQNNSTVTTYDFSSISTASWIGSIYTYPSYDPASIYANTLYFEIYVDPKSLNRMLIRVSEDGGSSNVLLRNSSNSIYTSISGFTNLTSIRFYNKNDGDSYLGSFTRAIDDLYLSGSGTADTTLIGSETYINRITPDLETSISGWIASNGNAVSALDSADDDSTYVYADLNTSGTTSLFVFDDIPASPTGLILVKSMNIARKTAIDANSKFINVMRSGTTGTITELGNSYTISGLDYNIFSSFIYNNPVTGSGWKLSEINNMQIGIKTQGTGV